MEAFCASTIRSARYLNLGDNSAWMTSQSASQMLAEFIPNQDFLEELHLGKNNMQAGMTTQIINAIRGSNSCLNSLKKVKLDECSWDTNEVCESLASFISEAT